MNKKPKVIKEGIKNFTNEEIFKINYFPILDKNKNLIDLINYNKKEN